MRGQRRPPCRNLDDEQHRQLVASISGPPTATPIAGAAASTALHVPATRVRRSSGNTDIMMASADGPVDAASPAQ